MKRIITKNPIVNIIIGLLLVVLTVVVIIDQSLLEEGIYYMAAGLIIIYSLVRFIREFKLQKTDLTKAIRSAEFVIAVIFSVLLIIWEPLTIAIALGLVLYLQGVSHLLILQVAQRKTTLNRFIIHLIFITVGAFFLFSGLDLEEFFLYLITALLAVYGIVFLIYGIHPLVKRHREKKSAQEKVEEKIEENAQETPSTYSKSALMNKSVDELRRMCKERSLSYSNLKKSELVEKLWLYEKE